MTPDFTLVRDSDARKTPVRVAVIQEGEEEPAVDMTDEPVVMTFPHLLIRELLAFLVLSLVLVALSMLFDAPLEEIANPDKTPNPAKAPWYFLGLQELLHYYPPVVSGVVLPGLLIVALAVVPYFRINLEREPMWNRHRARRMIGLWVIVFASTAVLSITAAHPVWPLIVPMWFIALVMTWSAFVAAERGFRHWLATRSIPFWVFTWFLLAGTALTVIGVFFRGPGWSFTLPWRDGMY